MDIVLNDGTGITDNATANTLGLEDISFSWALDDDTGTVSYGVSSDVTFCEKSFTYLESSIWDCSNKGCDKKINVFLNLKCCDTEIVAKIDPYTTEYCPTNCEITASIEIESPTNTAFECLKERQYWQGFYYGINLNGVNIPNVTNNFLNGFTPIRFDYQNTVPTNGILLKEALDNMAANCGLNFCSSIFDTYPYSNMVIIHSELTNNPFVNRNVPSMTGIQLLDCLKGLMNAEYQIEGDKLVFERKDYFNANKTILKLSDFTFDVAPCFQYAKTDNCSFLDIEYSRDENLNDLGNEQYTELYNDIIEWNNPPVPNRSGVCERKIKFSTPTIDPVTGELIYRPTNYPTLVIWDGTSPRTDATIHQDSCGFNTPLWVRGDVACDTLYQNFHSIDDPNLKTDCPIELTDNFTFCPNDFCSFFELVKDRGINIGIDTESCGIFYPKEIVISPKNQNVTFNELFAGE